MAVLALPSPAFAQTGSSGSAGLAHPKPSAAAVGKVSCTHVASSSVKRCTRVQPATLSALSSFQRAERSRILKARAAKAKAVPASPAAAAALPSAPTGCAGWSTPHPDRLDSCADQVWTLYTYTVSTDGVETVTGTFSFEDQQWTTYSATSKTWAHGVFVIGYDFNNTGDLASGFDGYLESNCSIAAGICTAVSLNRLDGKDPQSVQVTPGSKQEFAWDETDAGPSSTTASAENILDGHLGVNWEVPFLPPLIFYDTAQLVGRCDTMASATDGCADEDFTATLTYDSTANPLVGPVAQHVYDAQNGGLATAWGVPPSVKSNGALLYRDMNQSDINANRQAACGNFTPPPGDSCDEYPLASTYEGAAFNADYSVVGVPPSANSSQGGITSAFYTGNRVIDNDGFYVRAILPDGTASW